MIYFSFIFHIGLATVFYLKCVCLYLPLSTTITASPICYHCSDNALFKPSSSQEIFSGFLFSLQTEAFLPSVQGLCDVASPPAKPAPPPLPTESLSCHLATIIPALWKGRSHSSFCAPAAHVLEIHTVSSLAV